MLPVIREKRCERANDSLPVHGPNQRQLPRQTANGRTGRSASVGCPSAFEVDQPADWQLPAVMK